MKPIDGGLPGPGLLAHVLVSKYKDQLPLHRLSGIYARSAVDVKASTRGDWVAAGTDGLEAIARAIWRNALGSHLLQSDDTGIKVLDKGALDPANARNPQKWRQAHAGLNIPLSSAVGDGTVR